MATDPLSHRILRRALAKWRSQKDRVCNSARAVAGALLGNSVKTFWWRKIPNFGDCLTPFLLKRYGLTPVHSAAPDAQVIAIGSVLQAVPQEYSGIILGSGVIEPKDGLRFPRARILALRGPLTKQSLGLSHDVIFGDPGLLAHELLTAHQDKTHLLGIVPHYIDKRDERVQMLLARCPKEVVLIDVQRHPLSVVRRIARCEGILSSSLHGLIVADSLGIPNAWIVISGNTGGGFFKFQDYYSALHEYRRPTELAGCESVSSLLNACTKPSAAINEVQNDLRVAFRTAVALVREQKALLAEDPADS